MLQIFDYSLGIDCGDTWVRFVQTRKNIHSFKIIKTLTKKINHPEQIVEEICDIIHKNKLKSNHYVINIPSRYLLIKIRDVSTHQSGDLPDEILNKISPVLPDSIDRNKFAFQYICSDPDTTRSQLILALFKKNWVSYYFSQFVDRFSFAYVTCTELNFFHAIPEIYPRYTGYSLLIRKSDIYWSKYLSGALQWVEVSAYSGGLPTPPASAPEENPLKNVIYYGTEDKHNFFRTANFKIINFGEFTHLSNPAYYDALLASFHPFQKYPQSSLIGMPEYNILQEQRFFKNLTRKYTVIMISIILIIYMLAACFNWIVSHTSAGKNNLSIQNVEQLALLNHLKKENDSLQMLQKNYDYVSKKPGRCTLHLIHVTHSVPDNLWFSEVDIKLSRDRSGVFQISGFCHSLKDLTLFVKNLENFKSINNVRVMRVISHDRKSAKIRNPRSANAIEFGVQLEL